MDPLNKYAYGWLKRVGGYRRSVGADLSCRINYFDGSIEPVVGVGSATFTRNSSQNHFPTTSTIELKTTDQPCIDSYLFGDPNGYSPGLLVQGKARNGFTYHDDFTQWTAIGSVSITPDDTTAPRTSDSADKLTAVANNDGVYAVVDIDSGFIIASNKLEWGVFVKAVGGGNVSIQLKMGGDSGATPETQTYSRTATPSWTWVTTPQHAFTAAGTGKPKCELIIPTAGDAIWAYGAYFHREAGSYQRQGSEDPRFLPTTGTVANTDNDVLYYHKDNLPNDIGCVAVWAQSATSDDVRGQTIFFSSNNVLNMRLQHTGGLIAGVGSGYIEALYNFNGARPTSAAGNYFAAYDWFHLIFAYNNGVSGSPGDFKVYLNGSEIATDPQTIAVPTKDTQVPGNNLDAQDGNKNWWGLLGQVETWRIYPDATKAQSIYNEYKSNFGH